MITLRYADRRTGGDDRRTAGEMEDKMITLTMIRDAIDNGEMTWADFRKVRDEAKSDLSAMETVFDQTRDQRVSDSVAAMVRDCYERFYNRYGFHCTMGSAADNVRDLVASLVNRSSWDGRISPAVKAWAEGREKSVDEETANKMGLYTRLHMVHLNQIAERLMDYEPEDADEILAEDIAEAVADSVAEEIESESNAEETSDAVDSSEDQGNSDRAEHVAEILRERIAEYDAQPVDSLAVSLSDGNDKVGHIKNVSMPPVVSCSGVCAHCGGHCYDGRAVIQYPDTAAARARNWSIYTRDPLAYFGRVLGTVRRMRRSLFRWHVGGEIVDSLYFRLMVGVARLVPRVTYLCFTKRHSLVADEIAAMGGRDALPDNLRLILSAWPGETLYNPYGLPVSAPYVGERPRGWIGCPGNCETCAKHGRGCWTATTGDVIGFKYHGTLPADFLAEFSAWTAPETDRETERRGEAV